MAEGRASGPCKIQAIYRETRASLSCLSGRRVAAASCCDRNRSLSLSRGAFQEGSKKIQAICNGKSTPITMQGLVTAREKPAAREQWETMKKQWKEQWKQSEIRTEDYVRLYGGELTGG
jgi:hypothetical protein